MASIQLSDHFSYGRLLRFTWPSMMMMLITSIYGVVDGVMVSNFAGTTPFAALNLIWPFVAILGSFGFMIGTGGSALVAKTLGMGREEEARREFSLLTYSASVGAVVMGVVGLVVVRDVAIFLGAEGQMLEYCVEYGSVLLIMLPAYVLQIYFQSLLITAERPKLGMWTTIGAGLLNVVLDVLFIGVFGWGLSGAAWATGISQVFSGGIPLLYFIMNRNRPLRLGRTKFDAKVLGKASFNGVSEFVMQISLSMVSTLYMYQLLRVAGENGVAAYGIMMYFGFTFCAVFLGLGIGTAPVISYHYGAEHHDELHSLLHKNLRMTAIIGVIFALAAQALAEPLCAFFVGYDKELLDLTVHAFRIYSLMILAAGFNYFASAFFTALNNGLVSAVISLLRTMGFEATCVLTLPLIFGVEGIWWAINVAETLTMLVAFFLLWKFKGRYGY